MLRWPLESLTYERLALFPLIVVYRGPIKLLEPRDAASNLDPVVLPHINPKKAEIAGNAKYMGILEAVQYEHTRDHDKKHQAHRGREI